MSRTWEPKLGARFVCAGVLQIRPGCGDVVEEITLRRWYDLDHGGLWEGIKTPKLFVFVFGSRSDGDELHDMVDRDGMDGDSQSCCRGLRLCGSAYNQVEADQTKSL